jgi:hypothetical protein
MCIHALSLTVLYAASLKEGDKLIEVNGVNIANQTHQQVIQRIIAGGDQTILLVLEREGDDYYKSKGAATTASTSGSGCCGSECSDLSDFSYFLFSSPPSELLGLEGYKVATFSRIRRNPSQRTRSRWTFYC